MEHNPNDEKHGQNPVYFRFIHFFNPFFMYKPINHQFGQAKAEASPIDLLLTAEWPKGMEDTRLRPFLFGQTVQGKLVVGNSMADLKLLLSFLVDFYALLKYVFVFMTFLVRLDESQHFTTPKRCAFQPRATQGSFWACVLHQDRMEESAKPKDPDGLSLEVGVKLIMFLLICSAVNEWLKA